MISRNKWCVVALLLLIVPSAVLAQGGGEAESCPALVETALASVDQACVTTGRNEACYGNALIDAQPRSGIERFRFQDVGDRVDVAALERLQLAALDVEAGMWGVALLRVQANLPDTLPGQNVTLLAFGDVALEAPGERDSTRLAAAWNMENTPMQVFYFSTGLGDSACAAAPESGLLIQTPETETAVALLINGARVQLGSTAYLQAEAGGEMTISVVEGQAVITAYGETRAVPAGAVVRLPLDETREVAGPPGEPEPYNEAALRALPLPLLPRLVQMAVPQTRSEIAAFEAAHEADIAGYAGRFPGGPVLFVGQCTEGETYHYPAGGVYQFSASDGPNVLESIDAFSFSLALNGQPLDPVTGVFASAMDGYLKAEQIFAGGALPPGNYQIQMEGQVSQPVTDPVSGDTWGPADWTITCALVIEEDAEK